MNKKGLPYLFLIFYLLLFSTSTTQAQWHPSSLLDCSSQKWTVSLGGQYAEMKWQEKDIKTFDRQVKALVGFSVNNWLKVAGNFGYSKFSLRQDQQDDISFNPDYHWGGSIFFGPFYILPNRIGISGLISGKWFNPYSKTEVSQSTSVAEWTENREYILEQMKGSFGINLTFRTKTFDFFAGPFFTGQELRLKHQSTMENNGYSYELDRFSKIYNSGLVIGFMFGFGIRLPGQYYINFEIKNDNLNEFMGLFTLAQIGSP